jgi:hypothetical protein
MNQAGIFTITPLKELMLIRTIGVIQTPFGWQPVFSKLNKVQLMFALSLPEEYKALHRARVIFETQQQAAEYARKLSQRYNRNVEKFVKD